MTTQKCHVPGQVAFLTRRCTQRQYLLNNGRDGYIKSALGYLFALVAIRTHQVVHGLCVMSNHYHSVQTDRPAKRSKFMQDVNNFATKIVNKFRGRRESIWSSDKPSDVHLIDTETVIEKLLYVWLNPVKAGLVDRVDEWDNFMILPKHWGKVMMLQRPDYFTGESDTPAVIYFTPMPPPGFEHLPLDEVIALFEAWIRQREDEILAERTRRCIGMAKCYDVSPFASPTTPEPMYARNPKFAGSCPTRVSRVIAWYRFFRTQYRVAMNAFKARLEAVFPPGTVKMVELGCQTEDALPSHPNYPRYARFRH